MKIEQWMIDLIRKVACGRTDDIHIRNMLLANHTEKLKKSGGAAMMCVCGHGCGGTKECMEYKLILQEREWLANICLKLINEQNEKTME